MQLIDKHNWPRKQVFDFFNSFDNPHYNVTVPVDVSEIVIYCKKENQSFFRMVLYLSLKVLNRKPEFKMRIRKDKIILHDLIHPSFTVLKENNVFNFCTTTYCEDYNIFLKTINHSIEDAKKTDELGILPDRDDLTYVSSLPWLTYTSLSHPFNVKNVDSIPRISWGKYFQDGNRYQMSFTLQVNHALVDGIHVSEYFNDLQVMFDSPEAALTDYKR
jgi:chloramphenicol O-acetyltransferase type A